MHMDPSEVRSSGHHPFLRMFDGAQEKASAYASIWQVEYNPEAGAGNVLFLQSDDLTGGPIRIYSDNTKLARWVQEEIQLDTSDTSLPVQPATFAFEGDLHKSFTVRVDSGADHLVLTWSDFMPALASVHDAVPDRQGNHGHYAVYLPARQASVAVNGRTAKGSPRLQPFAEAQGTSAFVVMGETWTRRA